MLKRILAVLGLISAAAFIGITLWLIVTGQAAEKSNLMIISLCCFLGFGLLTLGVRWLENLRKDALKDAMEEAEKEKARKASKEQH